MRTIKILFLMLLIVVLTGCSKNDDDDKWTREITGKDIETVLNGHWELTGSRKLTSYDGFEPDYNGSADFNVPKVTFKIKGKTYNTTLGTYYDFYIVTADEQFIIKLTEHSDEIQVSSSPDMKDMLFKRQ